MMEDEAGEIVGSATGSCKPWKEAGFYPGFNRLK